MKQFSFIDIVMECVIYPLIWMLAGAAGTLVILKELGKIQ